jgi:hypothetical protein
MKLFRSLGLLIVYIGMIVSMALPIRGEGASLQSSDYQAANFSLYLPCVASGHCVANQPSPFSIQIAGLSGFEPLPGMTKAQIDQLREQEYAELSAVFPTLVDALRESGAGSARVYIDWSFIQPDNAASYNWLMYDSWISQVAAAGVDLIGTISNPPDWAIDMLAIPCTNKILPGNVQDFNNFLTTIVNRYKDGPYGIRTWEILNEPDAIDGYRCSTGVSNYGDYGADYATLLQGAYLTIHAADPTAKVIMGGLAYDWFHLPYDDTIFYDGSIAGQFNRYFIDDVVINGGASFADAVNIHYFHDFAAEWERWTIGDLPTCGDHTMRDPQQPTYVTYSKDLVAKGSHFLNRLKTCYGVEKPLWVTEVGFHGTADPLVLENRPEDTLDNQARYVFMIYARGLAVGAENVTWYALKIIPSITPLEYQGLLYDSRDGALENEPKPAFYAYQTLARELDGFQYSSTPLLPDDVEAYKFTSPCQSDKLIAWYNQPTGSVPLNLGPADQVRLVYRPDENGNDQVVSFADGDPTYDLDGAVNGQVTISLDHEPVIIQVEL